MAMPMASAGKMFLVKHSRQFIFFLGLFLLVLGDQASAERLLKIIQGEKTDLVDCIGIYEQPAFDHPLLKNHAIDKKPSFYVEQVREQPSLKPLVGEAGVESRSCPNGTVPVLRSTVTKSKRRVSLGKYGIEYLTGTGNVEVAGLQLPQGPYNGASADLNVWRVRVQSNEWSISGIILGNYNNYVEAGWAVDPSFYQDHEIHFYANWKATDVNGRKQGCIDLSCPGFIHVSTRIMLGGIITPVSSIGGPQYIIKIAIKKEPDQSKLWLMVNMEAVGYWPASLFQNYGIASEVFWVGGVLNSASTCDKHTTTQMGSGRLAAEGPRKAAYFANVLVMNTSNSFIRPEGVFQKHTGRCYTLNVPERSVAGNPGLHFYYGGSGGPGCC